jgi:tRNA-dihydrouridine synthase 3
VCAFGLACRFVGSHLTAETGALVVDEARQAANPPPTRSSALTTEQLRSLERRQAKTPRADAFWTVRDSPDADLAARKRAGEVRPVDFRHKLVLAPLTTVGHAAFRRVCKSFGADITVSEMALAHELVRGKGPEWALLRRHSSEDVFGVQLASGGAQSLAQAIELVRDVGGVSADYFSLNAGCPLDMLCNHGGGALLSCNPSKLRNMLRGMVAMSDVPIELKIRTGRTESEQIAHTYVGELREWGVAAVTLHGRARRTRYTEPAQRDYILQCARASSVPFIANGDIYSFEDAVELWRADGEHVAGLMIGRGALIKPWLFQEIKERRHIDISASERLEIVRQFCNNALDLFGSDARGVANARRYLCEWLSFAHRYVPVGILERLPSHLHEKPAPWRGRNELETLLGSPAIADWIKISGMFLGEAPDDFQFVPKHQSQAYAVDGAASDNVQG